MSLEVKFHRDDTTESETCRGYFCTGSILLLEHTMYTYTFTGEWMCKTIFGWKSLASILPILLGEETPCTYPETFDMQTIAQEQRGRKPPPTLCTVLVSGQDHEDHARRPDHLLPGLTRPGEPAALGCGLTAHGVCVEEVRSISNHDPHLGE